MGVISGSISGQRSASGLERGARGDEREADWCNGLCSLACSEQCSLVAWSGLLPERRSW